MKIDLTIIIVNWNGENVLPNSLTSIVANPPSVPYEIVVIDNASSDNSVAWLRSEEATKLLEGVNFRLVESGENLGFGRANNVVIEQTDSQFVFLLNPDTKVREGAIDRLLETIRSDEKIGAVAPKLLNEDGSLQPNVWAFPPTATKVLFEGLKLYSFLPAKIRGKWLLSRHWDYSERRKVPLFNGAAIMASRKMINEVGAFDPNYHMFGEDAEWGVRINRMGWNLYFEPEAEVYHLGGQSSIQRWGENEKVIKEEEGQQQFLRHCLTPFQMFKLSFVRVLITQFYRTRSSLLRRETKYLDMLFSIQFNALKKTLRDLWSLRR
jgi:GT2 family glycosyltransferase